jgi:hypothetical protein
MNEGAERFEDALSAYEAGASLRQALLDKH